MNIQLKPPTLFAKPAIKFNKNITVPNFARFGLKN